MHKTRDADLTLPSVVAALASRYGDYELVLTVVFHPDTSRIGERAVVPRQSGVAPWVLGRRSPDFGRPDGGVAQPLDEPHVSRRALRFSWSGKRLAIHRFGDSSRCRLGATDLYEDIELEWEELLAGVPMMLGHAIVLLLRLSPAGAPPPDPRPALAALRGGSASMADIREQVVRAGASEFDVLIRGETGTGKELVARAIHLASHRAAAPMVCVNMAAIPPELAAAALFGTARGAYTGADRALPGYFEQARGGSLFLDEIGETALQVQPQLLRALQQREVQAVGGPVRRVDVRVISATDAELDAGGTDFKAALRHRLGTCEIVLPPLREHPEDIGELLLYYFSASAEEAGRAEFLPDPRRPAIDIAAWAQLFFSLLSYHWPGNVRELTNVVRQIVLASDRVPVISQRIRAMLTARGRGATGTGGRPRRRAMREIDDEMFERAMLANDFGVFAVARELGVSRAAVYRRIEASPAYRLACDIPADELHRQLAGQGGDVEAAARALRVSASSLRARLRELSGARD